MDMLANHQEPMPVDEVLKRATPDQIRALAAHDLDVFAGLVMPDVAIYPFPTFYKELWLLCIKSFLDLSPTNKLFKLLLVLPRGHAKTTFVKLLIAYGIIHKLFDFPMVICASDGNAEDFVTDVCTLLKNDNVKQLYGDWGAGILVDNGQEKRAAFMGRLVTLKSASILSGSIRGSQKELKRPDCIVLDDVQTKEVANSEKKTEAVEDAIVGTTIKAKSPHRCGIIYLGNSYPRNCIAQKLEQSGQFVTLKTGAILANGTALWPELHSVAALKSEFRLDCALGKAALWYAEVLNQPLETDGLRPLFPDGNFATTIIDAGYERIGAFVCVDPAGNKRTSDDTAISGHVVWEGNTIEVSYLKGEILDPRTTILNAIAVAEQLSAPIIFVEAVAYQTSLCFWGQAVLAELGLQDTYQFLPIGAGGVAKLARIRAWVGELLSGQYIVSSQDIKAAILYQGLGFDARRTDNTDDLLDSCAYGTVVRNQYLMEVIQASEKMLAYKQRQLVTSSSRGSLSQGMRRLYQQRG
jgi:hypothetical protein